MLPDEIPLQPQMGIHSSDTHMVHGYCVVRKSACVHVFIQRAQLPLRVIVMDVFI